MGKPTRRAAPAGGKGATKGRKGKAPDPGQRLPKFLLAPYVDEAGCPFYCRGQEEDAVLKPASIAAGAASNNSEWASRLGIALSESSGVAEMGYSVLEELFPEEVDLDKAFKAMGIHKLQELMATPEAKKFLAACALLNKKNQAEITEDNLKEAVKDWHGWWAEESATKAKTFRKLARIAARLYLWSIDSLEQLAFATEPKAYAKAMKAVTTDDTPEAIKAWQKDPQSEGKLLKALRAGYRAQIQPQKKKARKGLAVDSAESGSGSGSAKAAASSDTSSPPAGSGSGDGSSSSEAAKKKKKTAEAKKAKAKAEKEKKDAKDKKKAKEKNEAKEKTKAKKEKKAKAKSKDTGKKEKKQKTDESNTEEASRESGANKRKRPASPACASMQDESSDAAAEEETQQQLLLAKWQLSEIQSSSGEWEDFIKALQGKTATAEDFTRHLEMIPAAVRAAFNLKVTKIPTKEKNLEQLIERINLIHSKGVAVWEAQQGMRASNAAPEVKEAK
eukprot:s1242_g12.t1